MRAPVLKFQFTKLTPEFPAIRMAYFYKGEEQPSWISGIKEENITSSCRPGFFLSTRPLGNPLIGEEIEIGDTVIQQELWEPYTIEKKGQADDL